ncbi:MAG TPA: MaoC family dehydratase [Deltaproteobacteria bacterium]|jgi:acyl dehydratase|nr:MAG: (R)-specific enoyl-CoA hydratase [Deltaproteobacteria bacterium ADurb.Bin072]HNQ85364.1 MaoC family dehydratase [Deltaproteobacteria bacterium]HRW79873.1 MaoC family dehydratase [Desulfomonilia bacterium]HNS89376.1 MaoC family dehydratase [Deltaproteobacteria bacterium]HOC75361.1 MaoC family dehydratase [Deltaproteobacteria bacterium]
MIDICGLESMTNRPREGTDRMNNPIRIHAIRGLREGDTFSYRRVFSREETETFGDLTRDYNPVHYDHRWVRGKGYKDLICHGLLVGSMICEFGGQVGWLATGMNFKFTRAVYPGDTITCSIRVLKIEDSGRAEAEASLTNQDGNQVCSALVTGILPLDGEREILRTMVSEGDPSNKISDEEYL